MHEYRETFVSWVSWSFGVALLWLQDHGLGLLGLVGVVLNMYLQLRKAARDDREGEARYDRDERESSARHDREGRESRARIDALERQTAAIESNAAAAHARIAPAKAEAEADVSRQVGALQRQNDAQQIEIDRATRGGG